jgi:hypothetical protein
MQLTPEGSRRHPARGDAVGAQNTLVISAPCSFNSGGQQCGVLLVDDEHILFFLVWF